MKTQTLPILVYRFISSWVTGSFAISSLVIGNYVLNIVISSGVQRNREIRLEIDPSSALRFGRDDGSLQNDLPIINLPP